MLVVEPELDDRARYRRAYRGPGSRWAEVSLELRVVENEYTVCGRRPASPTRLRAAHLVSEYELFLLGCGSAICAIGADWWPFVGRVIGRSTWSRSACSTRSA